ncbi:MAG: adenosine kinase [Candidatus Kapaibacteriales bacterium]
MEQKDIELCGLGNGLVDLLYEVTFEELELLGLRKGEMRIVDPGLQNNLLKLLAGKSYHICSGGSAANTIIAFSQFGGKSAYQTVLGNDDFGRFYLQEFLELKIPLLAPLIDEATGTCIVLITPDSERTMNTSLGATGKFSSEHIDQGFVQRAKWLYLEGYKFSAESSTKGLFYSIELAKKFNTRIALTVSDVFIIENFRPKLMHAIESVDLLFCNLQEALHLTRENSLDKAINQMMNLVPNFVITLGEKGSIIFWNNESCQIPAYQTNPIDTTGAGDVFAGGFMFGLIRYNNPIIAGHLASYASAKVVSQFGARLKSNPKEILNFIKAKFGL